jgi:hypothetical protein
MKTNNSTRWSIGIWVVASQKNSREHKTLKTTPYQLLYGQIPRVKASTLPWDQKLLSALETEVDLEKLLGSKLLHEETLAEEEEILDDEDVPDDEDVLTYAPDGIVNPSSSLKNNEVIMLDDDDDSENSHYNVGIPGWLY